MDQDLSILSPEESIPLLPAFRFPPYITLAHLFHAPEGWKTEWRNFPQYVLQYVVKGLAVYEIEDRSYTTKQGDLIMHQPGERNRIRTLPGEPYICISLVFHFGRHASPLPSWTPGLHDFGNYVNHPIESMLTQLVSAYKHFEPEYRLKSQGLLLQVLAELANTRRYHSQADVSLSNRNRMVLVKHHLMEHLRDSIDYKRLERITGLSRGYLIAQFKSCFGVPPQQYQLLLRIQRAKELALQSGLSVTEIAHEVGYADVHSFGKMFKKKTGLSLSQFIGTLTID